MKIRLQDLERLHIFFEQQGQRANSEDRYLWHYLLCQKPDAINAELVDYKIVNVAHEKFPAQMRFVNYMYDIGWADNFDHNGIEEAKDFIRFWITGETCDVWESLKKVVP